MLTGALWLLWGLGGGEAGEREDVAAGARQWGGTLGEVGLGNGKWVDSRLILKAKRMGPYLDVRESKGIKDDPKYFEIQKDTVFLNGDYSYNMVISGRERRGSEAWFRTCPV